MSENKFRTPIDLDSLPWYAPAGFVRVRPIGNVHADDHPGNKHIDTIIRNLQYPYIVHLHGARDSNGVQRMWELNRGSVNEIPVYIVSRIFKKIKKSIDRRFNQKKFLKESYKKGKRSKW